jgi:hypothetical protein
MWVLHVLRVLRERLLWWRPRLRLRLRLRYRLRLWRGLSRMLRLTGLLLRWGLLRARGPWRR